MTTRLICLVFCFGLASCQSLAPHSDNTSPSTTPQTKTGEVKTAKYQPVREKEDRIIPRGIELSKVPNQIAFGSCIKQTQPAPLLADISKAHPDLMLMMGDNVYASKPELQPISEQYQKLHLIPEYRALRESIPVMATWDDHDYGLNDGGADNPLKEEAKKEFLKEFSYVRDATTNSQPGLYHSKILGDKKRQVQIIMLDTRWNRSELTKAPDYGPSQRYYSPNNDAKATILGEKQWQWLAQELKKPASLKIIVSSIQVLGENQRYEKWANFPREKARLLELIRSSGNRNVVLFSGDRHIGVISQEKLKNFGTLYEATSSSLNSPTDFAETDPSYLGPIYGKVNYGLMKIDWVSRKARIEIRGINGEVAQAVDIKLH